MHCIADWQCTWFESTRNVPSAPRSLHAVQCGSIDGHIAWLLLLLLLPFGIALYRVPSVLVCICLYVYQDLPFRVQYSPTVLYCTVLYLTCIMLKWSSTLRPTVRTELFLWRRSTSTVYYWRSFCSYSLLPRSASVWVHLWASKHCTKYQKGVFTLSVSVCCCLSTVLCWSNYNHHTADRTRITESPAIAPFSCLNHLHYHHHHCRLLSVISIHTNTHTHTSPLSFSQFGIWSIQLNCSGQYFHRDWIVKCANYQ